MSAIENVGNYLSTHDSEHLLREKYRIASMYVDIWRATVRFTGQCSETGSY